MTLQAFNDSLVNLQLCDVREVGAMKMKVLAPKGGAMSFLLCPSSEQGAQVAFRPNSFTESDERMNICFAINSEVQSVIETLEAKCRQLTGYNDTWQSALRLDQTGRVLLKVKLRPKVLKCYHPDGSEAPLPTNWSNLNCNARILFTSVYHTGMYSGLQLSVTHLLWSEQPSSNPFL